MVEFACFSFMWFMERLFWIGMGALAWDIYIKWEDRQCEKEKCNWHKLNVVRKRRRL